MELGHRDGRRSGHGATRSEGLVLGRRSRHVGMFRRRDHLLGDLRTKGQCGSRICSKHGEIYGRLELPLT
jgi:hypothetical protein